MFLLLKRCECCYRTVILRSAGSPGPSPCQKRIILCNTFTSPFSRSLLNGSNPAGFTTPGGGKGTTAWFHGPVLSHYYCSLLLVPVTGNLVQDNGLLCCLLEGEVTCTVLGSGSLLSTDLLLPYTIVEQLPSSSGICILQRNLTITLSHSKMRKSLFFFFLKRALEFFKPKLVPLFKTMTSEGLIQLFPSKAWWSDLSAAETKQVSCLASQTEILVIRKYKGKLHGPKCRPDELYPKPIHLLMKWYIPGNWF